MHGSLDAFLTTDGADMDGADGGGGTATSDKGASLQAPAKFFDFSSVDHHSNAVFMGGWEYNSLSDDDEGDTTGYGAHASVGGGGDEDNGGAEHEA